MPTVFPPGNGGVGGTAKLPRSATIAGGIALAAFLYVAWIEWRPLLAMPPRAVVEGAEPLSMPGSRVGAGDADRATSPVPSAPLPPREPSVRESPAAAVAEGLPGSATTGPATGSSPAAETGGPERAPAALDEARARPGAAPADVPSPASEPDESREKPRRPLSLGGWVLDRDGNAAAAVPVQALPRRLFAALDDGTGNVPMPEPRFVTDGGGRFAFEQLPDGEYELRTDRTELYEKAMAVVRAGLDSAVIVVEKRSGRTLFVHGAVESSRGGPLKGVRVEVVGQPRPASISDESGQYGLRVPLGGQLPEPSMRFVRDGYREQRLAIGAAEAAGSDDLIHNVRLDATGPLSSLGGLVTGRDGPPLARAEVQLYSAVLGRRYQAATNRDGLFTLTDVEDSEDYRLWVHADGGYRDHVREHVEVQGQGRTLDVVLEPLGSATLRGSMVDPEGHPLPGFTLWLRPAYGGRSQAVTGDGEGRFLVSDLPEGPVALETRASPQLTIAGLSLAAGTPREVLLLLDVGPYPLEGHLLSERSAPVGGGRVSLQWSRADGGVTSRSFRETLSDARGYFVFTQLGAGAHTLSVTATGFRNVRLETQVGPDRPRLEIKLPASP